MRIQSDHGTIGLNPSAVFQLLIFADSESVRHAAALALEPLIQANAQMIECSEGSLEELPRWERTAALLVASLIERNPAGARDLGAIAPGSPARAQAQARMFRYAFGAARTLDRAGLERITWARATFALPVRQMDMFARLALSSVQPLDPRTAPGKGWTVNQSAAWLQLPERIPTSATRWSQPRLIAPDGRLHSVLACDGASVVKRRMLPLDPSLLLRLESGALRGHLLAIVHRDRRARADRAQDVALSIELGESMADPPVVSLHRGELAPRFDPRLLGHDGMMELPTLGGATLHELDRLARRTGVWHGDHLRGSFAYHPLRATCAGPVAPAREVA